MSTRLEKFIHKSKDEEGEDMLSKANANIKLFCVVHSETVVFSFTETVGLDYFEALSVFSKCVSYFYKSY